MYMVAWMLLMNGKASGPLHFSETGRVYGEILSAIEAAEKANEQVRSFEYCVIGKLTRLVMWSKRGSRIPEDIAAQPFTSTQASSKEPTR